MKKRFFLIPVFLLMMLHASMGQELDNMVVVMGARYEFHPNIVNHLNQIDLQHFDFQDARNIHMGKVGMGFLFPIGHNKKHAIVWDVATLSASTYGKGTLGFSFLGFGYRGGRGRVKGTVSLDLVEFVLGETMMTLSSAAVGFDCYMNDVTFFSLNVGTTYGKVLGWSPFVGLSLKKDFYVK